MDNDALKNLDIMSHEKYIDEPKDGEDFIFVRCRPLDKWHGFLVKEEVGFSIA